MRRARRLDCLRKSSDLLTTWVENRNDGRDKDKDKVMTQEETSRPMRGGLRC